MVGCSGGGGWLAGEDGGCRGLLCGGEQRQVCRCWVRSQVAGVGLVGRGGGVVVGGVAGAVCPHQCGGLGGAFHEGDAGQERGLASGGDGTVGELPFGLGDAVVALQPGLGGAGCGALGLGLPQRRRGTAACGQCGGGEEGGGPQGRGGGRCDGADCGVGTGAGRARGGPG